MLRLLDGRFAAICGCRWTGGTFHREQRAAIDEALEHLSEHGVDLQLVETRELDGRTALEHGSAVVG